MDLLLKKFHELCDDKPNTVTFIKIEGTEEILGGYNPLKWNNNTSDIWDETSHSFIFSFKNKSIKDVIISNVKNVNYAVVFKPEHGPQFGKDICIYSSNESTNYETTSCRNNYYEKKIRDTEGKFSIEDYAVFQIIRR